MIQLRNLAFYRLAADRGGGPSVEFALVLPVLLVLLLGIVETGRVLAATALLDGAVREAARRGITGAAGAADEAAIRTLVTARTAGLVDGDDATVATLVYPRFADVGLPEPFTDDAPSNGIWDAGEDFDDLNGNGAWDADRGRPGGGTPGEVVVYTVTTELRTLTGFVDRLLAPSGRFRLSASIAVRNEPFVDDAGGG